MEEEKPTLGQWVFAVVALAVLVVPPIYSIHAEVGPGWWLVKLQGRLFGVWFPKLTVVLLCLAEVGAVIGLVAIVGTVGGWIAGPREQRRPSE